MTSFSPAQLGYAKTIVDTGNRLGASQADIKTALMVALDESDLQVYANSKVPSSLKVNHDNIGQDGYSVGIFQQQVGIWGNDPGVLMDPGQSATLFFKGTNGVPGLFDIPGRQTMSNAQAAQAVQRSATSNGSNYAARSGEADELLAAIGSGGSTAPGVTTSTSVPWWKQNNWLQRVGIFGLGGVLIIIAVVFIIGSNKTVQSYAKTAAKAAAL